MKTFEQAKSKFNEKDRLDLLITEYEFKQIQLDAYKQGMIDAVEIVDKTYNTRLHHHTIVACKESILIAANNLTKLPE